MPGGFKLDLLQPIKPILFKQFSTLLSFILGVPIFIAPRQEIRDFSRNEWDQWVSVPGAFNLDHLRLIKPILFQQFVPFWALYWGFPFLLPQGRRKENSPEMNETKGYQCNAVPGAFKQDNLHLMKAILLKHFSTLLSFILGVPISYYPRVGEKGILQKWMTPRAISAWSI